MRPGRLGPPVPPLLDTVRSLLKWTFNEQVIALGSLPFDSGEPKCQRDRQLRCRLGGNLNVPLLGFRL